MRHLKLIFSIIAISLFAGCDMPEHEIKKYPVITSLENTLWHSYNKYDNMYFDIMYETDSGWMKCYTDAERKEEVSHDTFTYTFTPADNEIDAIIDLTFSDGRMYGGILIPKGNVQVNHKEVYMIQLYEVDTDHNILYDPNGNVKSTILMWKE